MKKLLTFIFSVLWLSLPTIAKDKIPVHEPPPPPYDSTNKPYAPTRINVEAWLDDDLLTIYFISSEGNATLSVETDNEMLYGFYPTSSPIIIDLSSYGQLSSFTIATESGHTYIGCRSESEYPMM